METKPRLKELSSTVYRAIFCVLLLTILMACQDETPTQASSGNASESQSQITSQPIIPIQDNPTYSVLESPLAVTTGNKIQVTELFWYGCGHCFALEPFVKTWESQIPINAEFVKVPAIFSQGWSFHGQAYYTMEALGILDQANDAFFDQIHRQQKQINDLPALVTFLADYNKSEEEVTAAFNSFAVDAKLRNAINITKSSTARGVPAFLVDGKYLTNVSMAGGQAETFEVINQLIEKAASDR